MSIKISLLDKLLQIRTSAKALYITVSIISHQSTYSVSILVFVLIVNKFLDFILTGREEFVMTPFDRLKKLADKQGLSINDVEEKVGLGKNTLYSWKKKIPSGANLTKIADFFNVSTDYLLGRDTKETKTADLADEDTVFTYEGRQIPPEDLEYMKRLLRGGK